MAGALSVSGTQLIRPITADDDLVIANIIRAVLVEYNAALPGTAFEDPYLDKLSVFYENLSVSQYLVAEINGAVVGGAGIGPLSGGQPEQCELQKMYLLPGFRGIGIGKALINQLVNWAKQMGYQYCYLETLPQMQEAQLLYRRSGFEQLDSPLGKTGHNTCDVTMGKKL